MSNGRCWAYDDSLTKAKTKLLASLVKRWSKGSEKDEEGTVPDILLNTQAHQGAEDSSKMSMTFEERLCQRTLQGLLGYTFQQAELLFLALTHSSWANEHGHNLHNERLEFLGDAVLELNISAGLYTRYPHEREGNLTRLRSRMVSEAQLAELAINLELGTFLRLGKGEEAQGGRERAALLADAVEAILGAVYLDGGHEQALKLIERLYAGKWPNMEQTKHGKDFKTRLQEVTQAEHKALPIYIPLGAQGPEHAKNFEVRLELPNGTSILAQGKSLKRAEQEAARKALIAHGVLPSEQA